MAVRKQKKERSSPAAFDKLRADVTAGTIGPAYLFYGEETFLREHWLNRLRQALIPPDCETFNFHRLEGRDTTVQSLTDAVEAMPMLSERTLTIVTDWDLFKLREDQRNRLVTLLNDLPPASCLVFLYDTIPYAPDKKFKKLYKALTDHVQIVEFQSLGSGQLVQWIGKQFQALGKKIDRGTAEYLIFLCGDLMTGLSQEIDKIAAYAPEPIITRSDIDAVADPVLDAVVFDMTNAVTDGDFDRAARQLDLLLKQREKPHMLAAAIGRELTRLYIARLALDTGRGQSWVMRLCGMRSEYPAKLMLNAARRISRKWCARGVRLCQELDCRLKSVSGIDDEGELKLLLIRLGAER